MSARIKLLVIILRESSNSAKVKNMELRATLKEREKESYRKMSRGKRIEQAIELSEFVLKLSRGMKAHGKRIQRDSRGLKRS